MIPQGLVDDDVGAAFWVVLNSEQPGIQPGRVTGPRVLPYSVLRRSSSPVDRQSLIVNSNLILES